MLPSICEDQRAIDYRDLLIRNHHYGTFYREPSPRFHSEINRRDARRRRALDRSRLPGYAARIRESGPGWAETPRSFPRLVAAPPDAPARAPERKARSRLE